MLKPLFSGRRWAAVWLLAVLAWSAPFDGGARAAHDPPGLLGVISGTVTDRHAEAMAELVTVTVVHTGEGPLAEPVDEQTTVDGRFSFTLPVGVYDLYLSSDRYEPWQVFEVGLIPDQTVDLRIALALTNKALQDNVSRGIAYLLNSQNPDGSWEQGFARSVESTSWAVYALRSNGVTSSGAVAQAVDWLRQVQNFDGSWGGVGDQRVMLTGLALNAVARSGLAVDNVSFPAEEWLLAELETGISNHSIADISAAALGLSAHGSEDPRFASVASGLAANSLDWETASSHEVTLWALALTELGIAFPQPDQLQTWSDGSMALGDVDPIIDRQRIGWWSGSNELGALQALALVSAGADRQDVERVAAALSQHQNRHRADLTFGFVLDNWDLVSAGDFVLFWGAGGTVPQWIVGELPDRLPSATVTTGETPPVHTEAGYMNLGDSRVELEWVINPIGQFMRPEAVGWDPANGSFSSAPDGGWGVQLGAVSDPRSTAFSVLALTKTLAPSPQVTKQVSVPPSNPAAMVVEIALTNLGRNVGQFVLRDTLPEGVTTTSPLQWVLPVEGGETATVSYEMPTIEASGKTLPAPTVAYVDHGRAITSAGVPVAAPVVDLPSLEQPQVPEVPIADQPAPDVPSIGVPAVGDGAADVPGGLPRADDGCSGIGNYGCFGVQDIAILVIAALTIFGGSGMVLLYRYIMERKIKTAARPVEQPEPQPSVSIAITALTAARQRYASLKATVVGLMPMATSLLRRGKVGASEASEAGPESGEESTSPIAIPGAESITVGGQSEDSAVEGEGEPVATASPIDLNQAEGVEVVSTEEAPAQAA